MVLYNIYAVLPPGRPDFVYYFIKYFSYFGCINFLLKKYFQNAKRPGFGPFII